MINPQVGAAILAVLIALSGCGQRGPLVLPKPPNGQPSSQGPVGKTEPPR